MTFTEFLTGADWTSRASRYGWDEAKARRAIQGLRRLRAIVEPYDNAHTRCRLIQAFFTDFLLCEGFTCEDVEAFNRRTRIQNPDLEVELPDELESFVFIFWCTGGITLPEEESR